MPSSAASTSTPPETLFHTGDSAVTSELHKSDPATPQHKTLRAHSVWRGRARADIGIRQFQVATSEPVKAGGDDSAPTPMELILAGIEGCLTVTAETVAAERGLTLQSIEITSEAVMDIRGFAGVTGVRPYYETIATSIELGIEPEVAFAEFAKEAERRCPALTMVRAADVAVEIAWVQVP